MKRTLVALILFLLTSSVSRASHITGGEMYYVYVGFSNGLYQYNVTLKLFQRCNSGRQFPDPAIISIFDKTNNARWEDKIVPISNTETISITDPDPCITNPPLVCYDVAYYSFTVSLPASAAGWVMASQVNYRIAGISNLSLGYSNIGATYTADIPGISASPANVENSSARFTGSDLVVVCANNDFRYSFAANDPDHDDLYYTFCGAYASTAAAGGGAIPTNPPPFPPVPYGIPDFTELAPLGPAVHIDHATGMLTGIAPPSGTYVITVCVDEIRNGVVIARQRKDVQINIADCSIASATLQPEYLLCREPAISLSNLSTSPLIVSTDWELYDNANNLVTSFSGTVFNYTFPNSGEYKLKLVINRGQPCRDSTVSVIKVYPGFSPDFTSTGICVTRNTDFKDQTISLNGIVNYWDWDFGESTSVLDRSSLQHPSYAYPFPGSKDVRLIVGDSKGCRDTVIKTITIIDKPPLSVGFADTLICINDQVQLVAHGSGNFSWSPPVNIINANSPSPTVSPPVTTKYYVDLTDNGCVNRDSVTVRVVNFVTLRPMADTTICKGDTIQLRIVSDGLSYSWTPASQLRDPLAKNPFAITHDLTDYKVTAVIGGCTATGTIRVTPVAYPVVNAGEDVEICFRNNVLLQGSTDGSSWSWAPAARLNDALLLNPVTRTTQTTEYILTAYDTKGCPKPGRDTVKVTVLPQMHISAGNDTAVVVGQPLHLNATGGVAYQWYPATHFITSTAVPDPVVLFAEPFVQVQYKVIAFSDEGCRDSAYLVVKVFKTGPSVFVPTGFTPNDDGRNDQLRPIAAGIKHIAYFNIYNRWGQLVFSTQKNGHGWDGKVKGIPQPAGAYVWMVKAIDYLGTPYFEKGTVTLIR